MTGSPVTVITYGTFDVMHIGHVSILQRLASLGSRLVVGVSTDEFNALKGKNCVYPHAQRAAIVAALRCVDEVFAEQGWAQKRDDIVRLGAHIFGMGDDWLGRFDDLGDLCQVVYLPRTPGVSSTATREVLNSGG